jgi:tRNA (cytidine/uridine-2'-O-)-methyltransferase
VSESHDEARSAHPRLNVVLIEPEIPQNTGSVGRLCMATGSALHLVKPLGFSIDAQALKRAGLDYWEHLQVHLHETSDDFFASLSADARIHLIETRAGQTLYEVDFRAGDYLIFGKETTGLADWILDRHAEALIRIPMYDARVRSLNLSNAVSITVYEALRQIEHLGPRP